MMDIASLLRNQVLWAQAEPPVQLHSDKEKKQKWQKEKHLTTGRSLQSSLLTQLSTALATKLFYCRTSKERCIWSQEQSIDIQNIFDSLIHIFLKPLSQILPGLNFRSHFPFPDPILYCHCYFDVFLTFRVTILHTSRGYHLYNFGGCHILLWVVQ